MAEPTPSQTIGPFFHDMLTPGDTGGRGTAGSDLTVASMTGEPIRVEGRLCDGEGAAVPDGLLEIWQADGEGRYAHPADRRGVPANGFCGFGRSATDEEGRFAFTTVKPGPVPYPDGRLQAPHILVSIFARGLLDRLVTRLYFAGEAGNDADPVLSLVEPERRATLLACRQGQDVWRFDIRLQGDGETVFFDL